MAGAYHGSEITAASESNRSASLASPSPDPAPGPDTRDVVHIGAVDGRLAARVTGKLLDGFASLPERVLRASFGDPPRNDRGVELDLATHALLRVMALTGRGSIAGLEPSRARAVALRDGALADLPLAARVERRELELDLAGAGRLPARVYTPTAEGPGPLPLLVWLHGGGFVIGGLASHQGLCSQLAARAGCVVVAVDYRKAPEHRFPAAVDDALASFRWIRDHADQLGARPDQLAIGGASAGGNLSAVVCQLLRAAGEAQPALQVLIYPTTDSHHPLPATRQFAEGFLLDAELLRWFTEHYLRGPEDRDDPRASPLLADPAALAGLAPALIRTAGFDPLRDEGEAYAAALRAAGVPVDLRCYERLIHNYIVMGRISGANRAAIEDLGDELRRFFVSSQPA
jgi:acetyl esterase